MSTSEIIEYEGRRFVRTGEIRKPNSGEYYLSPSSGNPHMARMDFKFCAHKILRELPAETPAPTAESEQDSAISALRVLNEETVLAGFPGGDRTQTLANVRAMAGLLAEAEEALERVIVMRCDITAWFGKEPENVVKRGKIMDEVIDVLARIRAAKEKL